MDQLDHGRAIAPEPPTGEAGWCRDKQAIRFPLGLPGFPGATRFTLERAGRWPERLLVMRSLEDPGIRFLMLPCAGATLPLDRAELEAACSRHGLDVAQVAVLLVVSLQPGEERAAVSGLCANRRAPVLLDTGRALGVQHVLDNPGYAVRWPLAHAA